MIRSHLQVVTTPTITPRMRNAPRLKTTSPREIQPKPLLTTVQSPVSSASLVTVGTKSLNKVQPVTRAQSLSNSTPLPAVVRPPLSATAAAAHAAIVVPAVSAAAVAAASPVLVSDSSGTSTPVPTENPPVTTGLRSDAGSTPAAVPVGGVMPVSAVPPFTAVPVAPVSASKPVPPFNMMASKPVVVASQILSGEPTKPSTVFTTVSSTTHITPIRSVTLFIKVPCKPRISC